MISAYIVLKSTDDICDFVKKATRCDSDIDAKSGSITLDGKSIEGLMSLTLNTKLECVLHCSKDDAADFISGIQQYMISDFETVK